MRSSLDCRFFGGLYKKVFFRNFLSILVLLSLTCPSWAVGSKSVFCSQVIKQPERCLNSYVYTIMGNVLGVANPFNYSVSRRLSAVQEVLFPTRYETYVGIVENFLHVSGLDPSKDQLAHHYPIGAFPEFRVDALNTYEPRVVLAEDRVDLKHVLNESKRVLFEELNLSESSSQKPYSFDKYYSNFLIRPSNFKKRLVGDISTDPFSDRSMELQSIANQFSKILAHIDKISLRSGVVIVDLTETNNSPLFDEATKSVDYALLIRMFLGARKGHEIRFIILGELESNNYVRALRKQTFESLIAQGKRKTAHYYEQPTETVVLWNGQDEIDNLGRSSSIPFSQFLN